MKKIFLTLMATTLACYACDDCDNSITPVEVSNIDESHYYWDLSVGPMPMPSMGPGIGIRIRHNDFGFDGGISFRTLFIYNVMDERVSAIYYFKNELNSFYIGAGLLGQQFVASFIEDSHKFMTTYGFSLVLGHETYDNNFVFRQVEISTPQKVYWGEEGDYIGWIPDITLRIGMAF